MSLAQKLYQVGSVFPAHPLEKPYPLKPRPCRMPEHAVLSAASAPCERFDPTPIESPIQVPYEQAQECDPLYLFACKVEWDKRQEPSAAWELLSAAQSWSDDSASYARGLLESCQDLGKEGCDGSVGSSGIQTKGIVDTENDMNTPYGLEIIESCNDCSQTRPHFFCGCSASALFSLDQASHKSHLPAGAILFVEGQSPRGVFIICSGRVNLSTTSREGKTLILKTAEEGEALGLSAAISGVGYEATAEAATPCQLNFVDRKHLLELMQTHSELSVRAAESLSRDFQSAYRDIHDLVLTRSSAGKLARLLLSNSSEDEFSAEIRVHANMTHEEMAQRIGASRETVTRLLSRLRKKQLIRLDGPRLVIRNRTALEALTV